MGQTNEPSNRFVPTDFREWRDKWRTKSEFSIVDKVRQRFEEMRRGRETNCPFPSPNSVINEPKLTTRRSRSGHNWADLWDVGYDLWSMHREYVEGRSNVKSPISFAPIEAGMAEFQEKNIGITFTERDDEDRKKVIIRSNISKHREKQQNYKKSRNASFHNVMITGSALTEVKYIRRERDVEMILSGPQGKEKVKEIMKTADGETKEKLEYRLKNENKPLTKKQRMIECDDIYRVEFPVYEGYPDSDARCMRGPEYEAQDFIRRMLPGYSQFLADYTDSCDPYVIKENVKRVQPAVDAAGSYSTRKAAPFFSVPSDMAGGKRVEILHYYNKPKDEYIITANDILIRKGPLPYNHKQIPISLHKFINLEDHFWGLGLPYVLESMQSEDEVLKNMVLEQLKLNLTPPVFIRKDAFEDIDSQWDRIEPGLKIEVNGDVGPNTVRWFEPPSARMDYNAMRQVLQEDAVVASGVNPIMFSMPQDNQPVRNNMLTIESTLRMFGKGIKNWGDGEIEVKQQELALEKQFYPGGQEYYDEDGKIKTKPRRIKTYGVEITDFSDYGGNDVEQNIEDSVKQEVEPMYEKPGIEVQDIRGDSSLDLRDEYFDLKDDIDIELDLDSIEPMSKALKLGKLEQAMDRLVPILANPELLDAPGVNELVRAYIEELSPIKKEKILAQLKEEPSKEDAELAYEQNKQMLEGQGVPGMPGRSENHLLIHFNQFMEILMTVSDPATPEEEKGVLIDAQQKIANHMVTDNLPKNQAVEGGMEQMSSIMESLQPPQQPPMGPEMQPGMEGMSPDQMMGGMPPETMMSAGPVGPMAPIPGM